MAITTRNTQVQGIRNSASSSTGRKHMMKKIQAMFIGLVLTAGLLTGSAVADEKRIAESVSNNKEFALLEGIPAEAMSAGEMEKVEGKQFVPFDFSGFYGQSPLPIDPALVNSFYNVFAPPIALGPGTAPTFQDGLGIYTGITDWARSLLNGL
jgi:hypothetical protein